MSKLYSSWQRFPMSEWRWPNFSPQEIASKGEGELLIDEASMDKLQALRTALGKPLIITSAYRSAAHNARVKGAKNSQHRLGKAFDVMMTNQDPAAFERAARAAGFTGFGHYPKSGFMHIDTGPARRWNDGSNFPTATESKIAPTPQFQTEPKRETITDIVTKPEVLAGAGSVLTGAGAVSQGSGPVQIALAIVMVVIVCAFAAWLVMKVIRRAREV
ncbi:putative exported protein [Devosia sp. LC5]|uniref:YcbK family protein n=1 Tax=Devosia sp. LC5 TaxID=1502724 RepID=UPI0004E4554F|nr:D-Ala-D-Ala carboxypeptidase family metallohydrolase [Devosia sp. LC5]KFC62791.1 putative exported protein [Devosia sp. LC5]